MAKWKAWLIIGLIGSLGLMLLWFGLAIVVHAERVDTRVDVTLKRSFLGVLPLSTEVVRDVTNASVYVISSRGRGDVRTSTAALEITSRDGQVYHRSRFGPSFGTNPKDMAEQIRKFLDEPAGLPFTRWWMPWLVNIGAIPFALISGGVLVEVLLRKIGAVKKADNN